MSGDMQREQGRRDWEMEAQQRYELEQLAEADRDQRVDVSSDGFALCCRMYFSVCVTMYNLRDPLFIEYKGIMEPVLCCPTPSTCDCEACPNLQGHDWAHASPHCSSFASLCNPQR